MKLKQKLILGFLSVALLVAFVGYVSVQTSQKALQKTIGKESVALAAKMLEHIDRLIYSRIETFQEYSTDLIVQRVISESNEEFENLGNIQAYISEKDSDWTSVPKEEVTAFMEELINNTLSEELREKIGFYEEKYGYRVFGEAFVTNKYGANAAQTGKTTDYRQDDEEWWQNAKKDGLYVADVEYDKSADVYSTDICIRIDDEAGNLLGVMKVVLNIEETINFIKRAEEERAVQFRLVTKNARIIYETEECEFLLNLPVGLSSLLYPEEDEHSHTSYFIAAGDKPGEGETLFAHAHSKGYRDYKGLGWILMVERETKEIFAPITKLKNNILTISLMVTVLAVLLGLFISTSISKPVMKLRDATTEIAKGNLDAQIEAMSNDEIGELAASFNDMAGKLQRSHAELEKKVRQRTEDLTLTNKKLEGQIAERRLAQQKLERHIRHLNCFYALSRLIEQPGISLEHIIAQTSRLIQNAYQVPQSTCVRITFNGTSHQTDNFSKTELSQHTDIKVHGAKAGAIDVYYLADRPENGREPFLAEEGALLAAVAEHLGRIAGRKQTAEKLQLFRDLLDRSSDAIFIKEPKWGRFLDVNQKACDSLGYTRDELLDMSIKDIELTIPDDTAWTRHVNEIRKKDAMVLEGLHKRKDGTTFPVEMNVKFIEKQKNRYVVAVVRDITERKQAEQRQAQLLTELESVNQELKDFAYIVSHDLKAPLRGIRTVVDWILEDYTDKLDDQGREQLNLLGNRTDRMDGLIEGILEYSRVGRVREHVVEVDLNKLLPDIVDAIAPPENISITIDGRLPLINCEETRTIQLFQNLLSNAVKYMDKPQGRISIACTEQDGFWKFSVADNGPGIDQQDYERIFQIFQTLAPRDEVESTGVGLTVVRKIVELYGGRIWVESKVTEGSTFFFTLPKQTNELGVEDEKLEKADITR